MASAYQTLDTSILTVRQVYARTPTNGLIPSNYVLASLGTSQTQWASLSTLYPFSSFNAVRTPDGSTIYADISNNILNISTIGVGGLFQAYSDPASFSLVLSNSAPTFGVALQPVPSVTKAAADILPGGSIITLSTSQTTMKFLGVGDILLSTVADSRAMFISISSFTSQNYSTLTAEAYAWRPTLSTTVSSIQGYTSFISSVPPVTANWNWSSVIGPNRTLSTSEKYPNFSTGDAYMRGITFTAGDYLRYIKPDSTTKLFLEMNPTYFLPRMFLGTNTNPNLVKSISSYVQYQSPSAGTRILPTANNTSWITSQQSNTYTSNVFTSQIKLELDSGTVLSNAATDGPNGGYYTLYHRIPGGMASLVADGYCGYTIGDRGGFSNEYPTYDNRQGAANTVYMHVYNS